MPYVRRNEEGQVESLHRDPVDGASEFLETQHPDVYGFFRGSRAGPESETFRRLDAEFVRVIEDVVDALFLRKILNIGDIPERAQAKLLERKSFRENLRSGALQLFGDGSLIAFPPNPNPNPKDPA